MLELAADLRLLDEPADHVGVVAEVLAEHLQGDVAAEVGVAPLEDGAHAAPGDLAVDPVARAGARIVAADRAMERRLAAGRRYRGAGSEGSRRAQGEGVEHASGRAMHHGLVTALDIVIVESATPFDLDRDQLASEDAAEGPIGMPEMVLEARAFAVPPR